MKFWRHAINEAATERSRKLVHWRGFLTVYADPPADSREEVGRQLVNGHLEVVVAKPQPEFSIRFHVGTLGSETPWDGHLTIANTGFYWGLSIAQKLADRLTRCTAHRWDGRDISIWVFHGRLHWRIWIHPDNWTRGEFAKWRENSVDVNPLDIVFGRPRYWYEDAEQIGLTIDLPEGSYPVVAKLQQQLHGRPKAKRRRRSWSLDVRADKGIPNRYDKSDGWKGDRVYRFGVKLAQHRTDWPIDAKAAITARILNDRADSGFRTAQEVQAR